MSDADSKRLTRTERRRQETHEALRTAVVDLLLREDQPRLTSRLVAEEADVAVGTFYNHFDSIEEAIDASLTPLTELILSSAQGALEPDDPTEGLGILIARFIDDLVTNADTRSKGHGRALLDWIGDYGRTRGCTSLHLDSGVQRHAAHRFYLRERMDIVFFHFRKMLD